MKALVKLFILLFVLVNITKAQVILPMGLGQKNSLNITCSEGEKMWVVSHENEKFLVSKWDGNFWIQYPDIPATLLSTIATVPQSIEAKAIYFYKNELFFALANKFNEKFLLIKSSGKQWETITTADIRVSNTLTFLKTKNDLLLCGKIAMGNQLVSIIKIKPTDCEIYAGLSANHSANDYFTDFEFSNNAIWAFGYFTVNTENRYFAKLENGSWNVLVQSKAPFINGNIAIGTYKDKLAMAGVDFDGKTSFSLQKNDSTWIEMSNGLADWKINSISDLRQIGQAFWAAGQFTNTKTNKISSLAVWDGSAWSVPNFDHSYLGSNLKLNGQEKVLISGNFVNYQGLLLNHTGMLDLGNAIIAGKVFNDLNENCIQDFGEKSLPGVMVKLTFPTKENLYINTDYNGRYCFPIGNNPDSYFVELILPKYMKGTCGNNLKPATVSSQPTVAGIDFGIISDGIHVDAGTQISDFTGWRARQGYEERYNICAENKGTKKIESGKLILKVDSRLTNWVFNDQPISFQSSSAEWNIKPLLAGERYCVTAKATIPLSIALESEILFDSKIIIGDLQDEDMINNVFVLKQKIVAAIDPNDKSTKQSYLISDTTTVINYKIRFQNTGNDVAENIVIRDTIDTHLILGQKGTIEDPSHEMKTAPGLTRLPNGNWLRVYAWHFEKIYLPDSNSNEEASHGYLNFIYNLSVKTPLKIGTPIRNQAYIYFDYQEPILTNVARNLVSKVNAIKQAFPAHQLSVYPNPANDHIYITNSVNSSVQVDIINSFGQIVLTKTIEANRKLCIPTINIANGLYMIRAEGYASLKIIVN